MHISCHIDEKKNGVGDYQGDKEKAKDPLESTIIPEEGLFFVLRVYCMGMSSCLPEQPWNIVCKVLIRLRYEVMMRRVLNAHPTSAMRPWFVHGTDMVRAWNHIEGCKEAILLYAIHVCHLAAKAAGT